MSDSGAHRLIARWLRGPGNIETLQIVAHHGHQPFADRGHHGLQRARFRRDERMPAPGPYLACAGSNQKPLAERAGYDADPAKRNPR